MPHPITLSRETSPPPTFRNPNPSTESRPRPRPINNTITHPKKENDGANPSPATPIPAEIELGHFTIPNHTHLTHFHSVSRHTDPPRLSIPDFAALYQRNCNATGRHFVVHQHDHPVAGVHYDLRLQFSKTSAVSWAIPYGLPGHANSKRGVGRMGIETRVHCLWNNVIESASHTTGSLLIWDTGEYEVLSSKKEKAEMTDDEEEELPPSHEVESKKQISDSECLVTAFQARHIRLRLHGTRLPPNYTITLRLPLASDHSPASAAALRKKAKRRKVNPGRKRQIKVVDCDTDSSPSPISPRKKEEEDPNDNAASDQETDEDEEVAIIRATNAYPGAFNTIGSIHQRHWFISLDRKASGFRKVRDEALWAGGWEPFFVRGREFEKSVVTGRLAEEVMRDEGVRGFVRRKMWRGVLE